MEPQQDAAPTGTLAHLDELDVRIIALCAQGWNHHRVAMELSLSPHAVRSRLARMRGDAGATRSIQVVVQAVRAGVV